MKAGRELRHGLLGEIRAVAVVGLLALALLRSQRLASGSQRLHAPLQTGLPVLPFHELVLHLLQRGLEITLASGCPELSLALGARIVQGRQLLAELAESSRGVAALLLLFELRIDELLQLLEPVAEMFAMLLERRRRAELDLNLANASNLLLELVDGAPQLVQPRRCVGQIADLRLPILELPIERLNLMIDGLAQVAGQRPVLRAA